MVLFLANAFGLVIIFILGAALRAIDAAFGDTIFFGFCGGWVAATIFWQIAHKSRYGSWFDPPVISDDSAATDGAGSLPDIRAKAPARWRSLAGN